MDLKLILTAFGTLLVAELGDKTQIAVLTLTARTGKPLPIFIGSAVALLSLTLLGVIFGEIAARFIPSNYLQKGAAGLFILIGILMFLGKI